MAPCTTSFEESTGASASRPLRFFQLLMNTRQHILSVELNHALLIGLAEWTFTIVAPLRNSPISAFA